MITVVEKLLSERFEGKARLDAAEEIRSGGRSRVSRYPVLEGPLGDDPAAAEAMLVAFAETITTL